MRYLIALTYLLALTLFPPQDAPKPAEPDYANTFYFLQADATLKPLERESVGVSTKVHALGYGGAEALYNIQGEHSSVRATASTLEPIIFKLENPNIDPANVVVLYTLRSAKGLRELSMARSHFLTGAKNTMQGKQIPLTFAKYGSASVKVAPASPLPPGEYAMAANLGATQQPIAFCFGID